MINNKSGKLSGLAIGALVFIALVIFVPSVKDKVFGAFGQLGTAPAGSGGQTAPSSQPIGTPQQCFIEDTTLTIGPVQEAFNPTVSVEASEQAYHRLFKNGVDKGLFRDSTTTTVNPGDKIDLYYMENNTRYYAAKQTFTVPCAGEVTSGEMPDSNAYKVYAEDANDLTKRVFNEDNGNLNSATDNESLAAGDVVNLKVQLLGTFEDAYSPYGKVLMVVDANKTVYDDFQAGTYPDATKPNQFSSTSLGTDAKAWAFELPGFISNQQVEFNLVVDVDDTVGPTDEGTGSIIRLQFFDMDWYRHTDTGVMTMAAETNQDGDVGGFNTMVNITTS